MTKLEAALYRALTLHTKRREAMNTDELARELKTKGSAVDAAIHALEAAGLAKVQGQEKGGAFAWIALPKAPAKASARAAEKKAAAWYGNENLVTPAKKKKWTPPVEFVDVGTVEAIEYESDKFDGKARLYRHDVTKKRRMLISLDGSTIVFDPPFRITKRGIEG